ncbi:MAG: sulfotransferase domain-containing protein [Cyanobacteria bacterium J06635_1]
MNNFCLIIGTQKGGTTSLFSYLSQHPQISASRIKETNFFSKDREWDKGIEYYESLWQWNPQKHQIALEASPDYTRSLLVSKKVIQRLKATNSKFRFIYILRDPLQKIESMRKQGIYQGWYSRFLAQETPTTVPMEVIERIRYATIVDKFVDEFSRESILLLKTENLSLKDKPVAVMDDVCKFLEIDPLFRFSLDKIHNSQNSYRNDTLWHALRTSNYLSPLKNLFPEAIKNNARNMLTHAMIKRDKAVPPLTKAQKKFILTALGNELIRLETDYSFDTSNWAMGNQK